MVVVASGATLPHPTCHLPELAGCRRLLALGLRSGLPLGSLLLWNLHVGHDLAGSQRGRSLQPWGGQRRPLRRNV